MATKSQEILLKGNTTSASAVPSSLKVREIAINALDRSLFTNDGTNIVKLYTGTTKWFDVNGNANNALKLGGILASEYINKETFNSHINNSTIHITTAERNAWNNKWDYDEETIKGVKVNAAVLSDSATKLQTARTIWGQSFDGSGDVNGILSITTNDEPNFGTGPEINFHLGVRGQLAMIKAVYENVDWSSTNPAAGSLHFYTAENASPTEKMRICLNGNILIGTTTDNGYKLDVNGRGHFSDDLIVNGEVVAIAGEGTPAGVTDYSALTGKPQINGVTLLSGNNTLAALGIQAAGDYATNSGVTTLLANYADKTFVSNNYVGKAAFNNHTADSVIHITSEERAAWNAKWDYNEATIKAVKVTSASSADSVAWSGISGKPSTFTPSAHTHTASDISGLPTALSAFTNDVGYITGITKSMVEGVLTGDISSHTHTFSSLTSKPTTLAGYGITDAYTSSTIDSKLAGYLPLTGGTMTGTIIVGPYTSFGVSGGIFYLGNPSYPVAIRSNGTTTINGNTLIHSGNYNSYAPTLTGTGASGTWGINISGNAATATNASNANTLAGCNEASFFRFRGSLYQNHDYNANNLGIGEYVFRSSGYGNVGTGNQHINALGENSTIQVFKNLQLSTIAWDNSVAYRVNWSGETNSSRPYGWSPWIYFLSTDNYNSYAPTLTGTGASGTWGISISGNAATATKLQTPRTIWGKSFDGAANVSGDINLGNGSDFEIGTGYNQSDTRRLNKIVFGNSASGLQYISGSWTSENVIAHNFKVGLNNTTALAISNSGNVIIGTTSDNGCKFQVNGNAYFVETTDLYEKNEATRLTQFIYQNIGRIYAYNDTEGTYRDLWLGNNRGTALIIKSNSNILIGTTTDNGYKLQVNGSERVYGDLIVDGEVSALVA